MIETLSGSFTIQPTQYPTRTLFATYLFMQLKIECPAVRVLGYHERDYKNIVWKIEAFTFKDLPLQSRVLASLNKPFWVLRQYFPIISIDKLQGDNAKECLNAMFPRGRHRLIQLGFLCAVDMLVNNPNRIPVLRSFPGNPKNVTFQIDNKDLTLKSQDVKEPKRRLDFDEIFILNTKIDTTDKLKDGKALQNFNSYITEVETLVETCCLHLRDIMGAVVEPMIVTDHHFESVAGIRQFIKNSCGYDSTTMAEFQLLLGIVIGFQMICRMGIDKIRKILTILDNPRVRDPKNIWSADLKGINSDFFQNMMFKVDRILIRFDDVLAYSHSVTVSQFSLQFGEDLRAEVIRDMTKWAKLDGLDLRPIQKEIEAERDIERYVEAQQETERLKKIQEAELKRQEEEKRLRAEKKLVDFEEIDKKIETMFGLRMGEFMKDDIDILKSQIPDDHSIITKKKADKLDDDHTVRDLANDLRSRRTGGQSKRPEPNSIQSGSQAASSGGKTKKSGTAGQNSRSKTGTQGIEEGEEEYQYAEEEAGGEEQPSQSRRSNANSAGTSGQNNRTVSAQKSKFSKGSQSQKPPKKK